MNERQTHNTKPGSQKDASPWKTLVAFLFCFAVISLIFFNGYAAVLRHRAEGARDEIQVEIDILKGKGEKLISLANRHAGITLKDVSKVDMSLRLMYDQVKKNERLLPILENQFVVIENERGMSDGENDVFLTVPKNGSHRLWVRINSPGEPPLNSEFDLESGNAYKIEIGLKDETLRVLFPGHEPLVVELNDFDSPLRFRDIYGGALVSPNQPRWGNGMIHASRVKGVLSYFQFYSKPTNPTQVVNVSIGVESDGPMTAAADDPDTVRMLLSSLDGSKQNGSMDCRFGDGRYTFEFKKENGLNRWSQ